MTTLIEDFERLVKKCKANGHLVRIIDTEKVSPEYYEWLGGAVLEKNRFLAWHVTDNPERVCNVVKSDKSLVETGDVGLELGPGLYASAAPQFWIGRAGKRFEFVEKLLPEERKKLAEGIINSNQMKREGYLTQSEKERVIREVNYWLEGKGDFWFVATQPYNIDYADPKFLENLGLGHYAFTPSIIKMELKGKFGELSGRAGQEEIDCLRKAGLDGVFTQAHISTNPEMVLWNKKAIVSMDSHCEMVKEKNPKDIVICTNIDTLGEEVKENFDPNYEDFWPVANYPKDIEKGKSRLYLSANGKILTSFLIKDEVEREWRGEKKKVLLLEKKSARIENIDNDRCAAMGGFRYLDKKEVIK